MLKSILAVASAIRTAVGGLLQVVGPSAGQTRTMTVPDADFMAARSDAAQTLTGNQTISAGNLVVATAGRGVDFSANTNAAGMTSELLTWYEEGTWTATLSDGTNNATMSASSCRYTRVGRLVTVGGYISISSRGSISAVLRITGLPFTCANALAAYAGGSVNYATGLNITAGQNVVVLPELNTTYLGLYLWNATTGTGTMVNTHWTDSGAIAFSANYTV